MNNSEQEILRFVEENDVKFVKLAFCDLFGVQKNVSLLASELPRAFSEGISFDGSSVDGFLRVEESDLVLWPDPATVCILPWRPADGRVMRMFCDIRLPGGAPFAGSCRDYLQQVAGRFAGLNLSCNVGSECEFYLFEADERGDATHIPMDRAGYFDVAPLDRGENIRREICLTLEEMGLAPRHSHHEHGPGQNEIDFLYGPALAAADDLVTFKSVVRAVAARSGLFASFLPKPIAGESGSGLHLNISLHRAGQNLFAAPLETGNPAASFLAGVLARARELTVFLNPIPNSYTRFGCCEAPGFVSWSRQNRSQLVRIPSAAPASCRMELRSPDPACNPYLAIGLVLAAGLEGIEQGLALAAPVDKNLFVPGEAEGLDPLPRSLAEALKLAENSDFLRRQLPPILLQNYLAGVLRRIEGMAGQRAETERERYFLLT